MIQTFFDYIVIVLIWLCASFVVGVTVVSIDSLCASDTECTGVILNKEFIPRHTTTITTIVNKIPMSQVRHHPDNWVVYIGHDGDVYTRNISEQFFNTSVYGQKIAFVKKTGFLMNY